MHKMKRNNKKTFIVCLLLVFAFVLTGCSSGSATTDESLLESMKEFSLPNGSASLYLNKKWITEDAGLDNFLIAGTKSGSDAVFMFQFTKNGSFLIESIEDMKELVEESFQISDEKALDAFEIPNMSNISVSQCKMSVEDMTGEGCLVYGETENAFYAIGYIGNKWNNMILTSLKVSCSKFSESEDAFAADDATTAEITDTIRWFNASYAILTEQNGWDYNRFAGLPANEVNKQMEIASLEEWWGVTDRASADETLDWILSEGHRTAFAEDMLYLQQSGLGEAIDRESFLMDVFDLTSDEAKMYLSWYEMYEQYGENAIDGWDYCRALNLMSFYYLAGYYTEQEALDKSLEIAQTVQPLFDSWDDLVASYMRGYEYWAEESSAERQATYEEIKARDDNPYQVDFKMDLQKTW